ncbi:protein kinase [Streptomyces sp. NPDC088817]|uniref:serine/threonine-protein kinase n=1 Tax=unclassified Streptomyces TaxID=2593676 RepID=UPI0036E1BF42
MERLGPGDPQRIGAYRLLARLGAGGMGQVFLARSDRGRTAAVKLVRPELAQREEFRARFRQEVRAARQVGGYWTAPVLDADTEAAVPWVATGYVAGPSLQRVVGRDHGPLPERSVRILAAGLAGALKDIHAAGLIHRDLKPSNVLVTIDGPRVIDFGIARALETVTDGGLTRTGALVGSPGFMAPEQVRGDRVTTACDVFCLGSVLAYAATGALPFGGADSGAHALMYRIAETEPDLDALPEGIADLVGACLRKDPAARPTVDWIIQRTGAEDTIADGRLRDPWLPSALVAQLGRHAVQLLEAETPDPPEKPPHTPVALPPPGAPGAPGAMPSSGAPGAPVAVPSSGVPGAPGAPGAPGTPVAPGAMPSAGAPSAPVAIPLSGAPGTPGAVPPSATPGTPVVAPLSGAPGLPGVVRGAPSATKQQPGPAGAAGTPAPGVAAAAGEPRRPSAVPAPGTPGPAAPGVPVAPGAPAAGTAASDTPGPHGPSASSGAPGTSGAAGAPGAPGPYGAPASSGPPGAVGAASGVPGPHGPSASSGAPGSPGAGGASGAPGPYGAPPPSGPSGAVGAASGAPGSYGPSASAGTPGVSGGAGASGGFGAVGAVPSGAPGPHGPAVPPASVPYGYPHPHSQPAAYDHSHPHPQPTAYGYPQQHSYGGLGRTQPYGPGPLPEGEPRRSGRSTAALVAVALLVALGAGGSVYTLMRGGGDGDDKGGAPGPTPTVSASTHATGPDDPDPSPSPSPSPSDGPVPAGYLGSWTATIDNAQGTNSRRLTITQGDVGDTVLTLVADGPIDSGGTYHCVFEARLTQRPSDGGPLEIGPSVVTTGRQKEGCNPGAATQVVLLPDGTLQRVNTDSGEKLTYTRR